MSEPTERDIELRDNCYQYGEWESEEILEAIVTAREEGRQQGLQQGRQHVDPDHVIEALAAGCSKVITTAGDKVWARDWVFGVDHGKMTVAELRERLESLPGDMLVGTEDADGTICEIQTASPGFDEKGRGQFFFIRGNGGYPLFAESGEPEAEAGP